MTSRATKNKKGRRSLALWTGLTVFMACCMGLVSTAVGPLTALLGPYSERHVCGPAIGECEAAQTQELFSVDVGKQKEVIAKELDRIDEILYSQAKLQESRSAIEVLEHKIDRIRKSLTKEDLEAYRLRLEKQRKAIPSKEDSLINKTMEILHGQGVEASLQFTQNDLLQHGVSGQKITAVERRILEEAPAIKQAQEREQIARVLTLLESGQLPDSSFDPYIVRTAQLIMKAHEDSLKRIDESKKRKELEGQERLERAQMEKEMKEKKLEEERLAKQRKEEEKKNAIEQAAERKRLAAEEKEKQRQARSEEERIKHLKAEQEEARNDSIERQRQVQQAAKEELQAHQLLAQQEKAKSDSIERQRKAQQIALEKQQQVQQPQAAMAPASVAPLQPSPPVLQPRRSVSVATQPTASTAEVEQRRPIDKAAQAYLQSLKEKQKEAQKKVMDLYDLVEQKQGKAALDTFKQYRSFISKYVEAQVFNVLELTVFQSVMESQAAASPGAGEQSASSVQAPKTVSPEQQRYNLINGYLRDNKIDAAYAEFKRGEKQLKNAMTKQEFKQLKNMVENAYKTRHQGK